MYPTFPVTKIERLKAAREHWISAYQLLTPYTSDWYEARRQLANVTEEGEELMEKDRVARISLSFQKSFPSTNQSEQDWQCPICKESQNDPFDDPSSCLPCCDQRICLGCLSSLKEDDVRKCPHCKSKEYFPLTEKDEVHYLQSKNETWAYFRLGMLLQQSNHEKSAEYFRLAEEGDHPIAIFHLGSAYFTGSTPTIPQSITKAREYFEKSAKMGYHEAQYALALLCLEEDDDSNVSNTHTLERPLSNRQKERRRLLKQQEGLRWLTIAAHGGNSKAHSMLASLYINAFGKQSPVKKNIFRAKYWASQSPQDGASQILLAQTLLVLASQSYDGSYNRVGYNPIPKVSFILHRVAATAAKDLAESKVKDSSILQKTNNKENATKMLENLHNQLLMSCACCKKKNLPLKQCGRCHAAYYCSKDCIAQHWRMGHKKDCLSEEEAEKLHDYLKVTNSMQQRVNADSGIESIASQVPPGAPTSVETVVEAATTTTDSKPFENEWGKALN